MTKRFSELVGNPNIFQFGNPGNDQRLWQQEGQVYVFDWSGKSPATCEDGPLRVDRGGRAVLGLWSQCVEVRVPVIQERTEELMSTSMSLNCFEQLLRLVPTLTVESSRRYDLLAGQVFRAEALRLLSKSALPG